MSRWTEHRYAVIDVEGNGRRPPDLVELAVVSITAGAVGEPASWLFKPDEPITAMARRIHGITNDMVADASAFADLAAEIWARVAGAVLVAHNAGVDLGVLRRKLPDLAPAEVLDTLKLSRRLLPGQASYRLGALVTALHLDDELPLGLRPHRASYDALVTARLLVRLATRPDGTPWIWRNCKTETDVTTVFSSDGLFVSIDGPSGVGKSATARALARLLTDEGRAVHLTGEPSEGPIGELACELTETVRGIALACLYAADRYHHLTTEVIPHLEAGEVVVTDRYVPSALVMQQLDGVGPDYLWRINAKASRPHLAVILDADPAVVAERLSDCGPHNRLQRLLSSAHIEWHHYHEVTGRLADAGWRVQRIDCSATTVDEVARMVRDRLSELETAETRTQ